MKIFANDYKKTLLLGKTIGKFLATPIVLYLKGDLGTGKTHLSKGIAEGLGISEDVTSPTFTLINEYSTKNINLYHLDVYRLPNLNSILDLGIEDFVSNQNSVTIIEWAEKLENYNLFDNFIDINVMYNKDGRDFIINLDSYKNKETLKKEIESLVNTWN
jgi:tRNA threonylcarbamoyladenosine biosynthesis protein TsaE